MNPSNWCFLVDENLVNEINDIDSLVICSKNLKLKGLDLYTQISIIGLELQKRFIQYEFIYADQKIPKVIIFFDLEHDNITVQQICDLISDFRGDEIAVNINSKISWVAGHYRSILKWSLPMFKIKNIEPIRELELMPSNKYEKFKLIWWAERLNLKVYTL